MQTLIVLIAGLVAWIVYEIAASPAPFFGGRKAGPRTLLSLAHAIGWSGVVFALFAPGAGTAAPGFALLRDYPLQGATAIGGLLIMLFVRILAKRAPTGVAQKQPEAATSKGAPE